MNVSPWKWDGMVGPLHKNTVLVSNHMSESVATGVAWPLQRWPLFSQFHCHQRTTAPQSRDANSEILSLPTPTNQNVLDGLNCPSPPLRFPFLRGIPGLCYCCRTAAFCGASCLSFHLSAPFNSRSLLATPALACPRLIRSLEHHPTSTATRILLS
jgi:hypothetical protein